MTDDELKALVASLAIDSKNLHEAQKATDEQMKRTDEQMKRTDEQMKRTDEKLERIGVLIGNIGQNQGAVAEEFFYNSLKVNQTLGGVHYDFIDKGISRTGNGVSDEYDMILVNGQDVAIVEVKYKAHEKDLDKLLTKNMTTLKSCFPYTKITAIIWCLRLFTCTTN